MDMTIQVRAVINIAGDEVTDSMLAAGDWLLLNSSTKLYKIKTVVYTAGTDTTDITIKGKQRHRRRLRC